MTIVKSISHLKKLTNINGFAKFYIILAGGLYKSGKRIMVPTIIKNDLLPTLSTHKPNNGVAIIAAAGSKLFNIPAASLSNPCAC